MVAGLSLHTQHPSSLTFGFVIFFYRHVGIYKKKKNQIPHTHHPVSLTMHLTPNVSSLVMEKSCQQSYIQSRFNHESANLEIT